MADHADAQAGARLDQVGEVLGQPTGPDHEHVAGVVAALAQVAERHAQHAPLDEGDDRLRDEDGEQEEPADVVPVNHEEGRRA